MHEGIQVFRLEWPAAFISGPIRFNFRPVPHTSFVLGSISMEMLHTLFQGKLVSRPIKALLLNPNFRIDRRFRAAPAIRITVARVFRRWTHAIHAREIRNC